MPTLHNLEDLIVGDDPIVSFAVTDKKTGAVIPLTGKRVEVIVKADPDHADTAALYTLSSEGATPKVTIVSAAGGTGTFDLSGRLLTAGTTYFRAYLASVATPITGRRTFATGRIVANSK